MNRILILGAILLIASVSLSAELFFEEKQTFAKTKIALIRNITKNRPSRGLFVYTHGMTSRYAHHMNLLKAVHGAGFDVIAYDLPGHGSSERAFFNVKGSIRSFNQFVDVLDGVIAYGKATYGSDKVFLSGWSLGGIITTVYLQRNPGAADAAVMFAPGVSLALIHGDLSLLKGVDTKKLVQDPELAKKLAKNPGFFRFPPPSLATHLLLGYKQSRINKRKYQTPSLILTAGRDTFAHTQGVQEFFRDAGKANMVSMELVNFAGSFHDVENDIDSDVVMAAVVEYLKRKS